MTYLLFRFWKPLAVFLVLLATLTYAGWIKRDRDAIRAEYATFVAEVRTAGEAAKREAAKKEKENADRVKTALADRDRALKRLRESRPVSRIVPDNPAPAGGDPRICFRPDALDAALREFAESVKAEIAGGDATLIDARSLLEAWPR